MINLYAIGGRVKVEANGFWLGLMGVALFSLTLPLTKIALDGFDPVFIGSGRSALAGVIALIYILVQKIQFPDFSDLKAFILMMPGIGFIYPIFTALALSNQLPSHGGVILGILPLATACFSSIYAGQRPSRGFWLASILGTILVVGFALLKNVGSLSYGDCLLFLACLAAAIAYAVGGTLSMKMNPIHVISWTLVFCLPLNLIITYFFLDGNSPSISPKSWMAFLWLAISSSYVGFFFWYGGLALGGVVRVSQLLLLQPVFTLLFSFALLNDPLTMINLIFTVLIICTVIFGKNQAISKA